MRFKELEPKRSTVGSAGYDIHAPERYELKPGEWTLIDTEVALTDGDVSPNHCEWFLLLVPRSGLSDRYGLRFRTTVGIIDMDYRDTIKARVTVDEPYTLEKGERFAQVILIPYGTLIDEVRPVDVRDGGFGSTGKR